MRRFAALFAALDATTKTLDKQRSLEAYFREAPPADAAWATFFLTGRRLRRLVRSRDLRDAALQAAGLPEWLFDASHQATGDLAETIALLLPPPTASDDRPLADWVHGELRPLADLAPAQVREQLQAAWQRLAVEERFVHLKLITGAFRVGVAKQLVYRALSSAFDVPVADVAQRLVGDWTPDADFPQRLRGSGTEDATLHRPYPFFLAHSLDVDPATLGDVGRWQVEWKWDGIRAQLVARPGVAAVWSRGEELANDAFPELVEAAQRLPRGTVVDGEILVWREGHDAPGSFATLQKRLNRRAPPAKLVGEAPVALVAYDLLERDGRDIRAVPLAQRRAWLRDLVGGGARPPLRLSPTVPAASWDDVAAARGRARERGAEGLMLKHLDSAYGVGRPRGAWWKWKVDPYTVDAVLVYAQPGSGRRASLFTDYTFAVWDGDSLVPFAKAYSGLSNAQIARVDAWIRSHTLERFGPVRSVQPQLVFELAFEGLQLSTRHKSGIAVRFPRIVRWRSDKSAAEADTLATLRAMAEAAARAGS
jgi:DNA ligase-1